MTPYHAKYWAYELTRRCPADSVDRLTTALVDAQVELTRLTSERQERIQSRIRGKNAEFFAAEVDKLDWWADDLKLGLEREIKELDKQIKKAR